jgi:signal transduction histidine kinase
LNARNLAKEQERIRINRIDFQVYLLKMFACSVFLALGVAGVSMFQVSRLERRSEEQRNRAERAERELRYLSHKLVQAQEEERKSISRELHDEIGQLLTALKMELDNLEQLRSAPREEFQITWRGKGCHERTMRSVRDLSADCALDARRYRAGRRSSGTSGSSRTEAAFRCPLKSTVILKRPETVNTCIYRVTQESDELRAPRAG